MAEALADGDVFGVDGGGKGRCRVVAVVSREQVSDVVGGAKREEEQSATGSRELHLLLCAETN